MILCPAPNRCHDLLTFGNLLFNHLGAKTRWNCAGNVERRGSDVAFLPKRRVIRIQNKPRPFDFEFYPEGRSLTP